MKKQNWTGRQHETFDWQWLFMKGNQDKGADPALEDREWRKVDLPHDYSIEGDYHKEHPAGFKGGFLPTGVGWYRKHFTVDRPWLDKRVLITFDGVYMNSDVWINGVHLGHRPYGYIGFQYDISDYIHEGDNVIAVKVDHEQGPTGRWYTGSGIYRHTWLTIKDPLHIQQWGTYVTTPEIRTSKAKVVISSEINNTLSQAKQVTLGHSIYDEENNLVAEKNKRITIDADEILTIEQAVEVQSPKLWSVETPYQYRVRTTIIDDELIRDEEDTYFGIRYFSFNAKKGFTLNGRQLLLKGVCQHHDAGPVGVAVPEKVLERRLRLLKEMGCNAIRTGHTPFAPEFYQMCDRLGFLVMNEIFDGWEKPKMPYDYGLYFKEWWQRDLGDFLKRDRNHPSVILWSIGNEVLGQSPATTQALVDFIHELEPTRPVTCGVQRSHQLAEDNRALLDVAGYNGGGEGAFIFERDHKKTPDRVCIATEIPHTFQTRGFYRTQTWWRDKNKPRIEIDNLTEEELFYDGALAYNSSYDNSGVRISARDSWKQTKSLPYLVGEFRWTGFDYLGESFGWPARSANFGVLDLAGFKKDHFYFYQSQWTKEPMVHILPHWTHPDKVGATIPVWVYSNCESVELLLNGTSLGEKKMGEDMHLQWDVEYQPGKIEAIGKISDQRVSRASHQTSGSPENMELVIDNQHLNSDKRDISHVEVHLIDNKGIRVPHGSNQIHLITDGPVVCLGTENGDPLDLTQAKSSVRRCFNGSMLGIFQSTVEKGRIHLIIASILGEAHFTATNQVSIQVHQTMLRGQSIQKDIEIYYTLDGRIPDNTCAPYLGTIRITRSCKVRAAVYHGSHLLCIMEEDFVQGQPIKIVDHTHGNRAMTTNEGPFAKKILGCWQDDAIQVTFYDQGKLLMQLSEKVLQGQWWYDYPADPFENPDDAGMGELICNGERGRIRLVDQSRTELIIEWNQHQHILTKGK